MKRSGKISLHSNILEVFHNRERCEKNSITMFRNETCFFPADAMIVIRYLINI